jgi:hypothetical protein
MDLSRGLGDVYKRQHQNLSETKTDNLRQLAKYTYERNQLRNK